MIYQKDRHHVMFCTAFVLVVFTIVGGGWIFKSYMEARAFNRVTGKNVSTVDAMFIQLRVQEGSEEP